MSETVIEEIEDRELNDTQRRMTHFVCYACHPDGGKAFCGKPKHNRSRSGRRGPCDCLVCMDIFQSLGVCPECRQVTW